MQIITGWMVLSLLAGACAPLVPAKTPPQLEHTPGTFVVVTHEKFDAGVFQVEYPRSWRVVKTSIASAEAVQVVFVAPDDSSVTVTEVDVVTETTSDNQQIITLDNGTVVQVVVKPAEVADASFRDAADHLIDSIRP